MTTLKYNLLLLILPNIIGYMAYTEIRKPLDIIISKGFQFFERRFWIT